MDNLINFSGIEKFKEFLIRNEKSAATIEKYIRDIKSFLKFSQNRLIDKILVIQYKKYIGEHYAVRSANSMLTALNIFFRYFERYDLCVKLFKLQKDAYSSEEKELSREEYVSLVKAAQSNNNERLALVVQTICCSGIRVSELKFITVEAVKKGEAIVNCKGKSRKVYIVSSLKQKLIHFAYKNNIKNGAIFITKNGKPLNRSNIWRDMKNLCRDANVNPEKVFPHNLRHLLARTFYNLDKDISKLADILGHSNINTTRIYIMTTFVEHRNRIENMKLVI